MEAMVLSKAIRLGEQGHQAGGLSGVLKQDEELGHEGEPVEEELQSVRRVHRQEGVPEPEQELRWIGFGYKEDKGKRSCEEGWQAIELLHRLQRADTDRIQEKNEKVESYIGGRENANSP